MNELCPGHEAAIQDAKDLQPEHFRRLVVRRARQLLGEKLTLPADETARRKIESDISKHFEKIHKGADFLPARFLVDGAKRARAVCRITTPGGWGTGFLVARGYVMTNNHVLASAEEATSTVAEFGFEEGGEKITAAIRPDRFFLTNAELDYTVVACDDTALQAVEPIQLKRSPATVTRGERVNVIQHPRGRPKEVALHDNRVTRVKDTVLHYQTDTDPGSSGSPVFNNAWDLVALHHAGWSEPGGAATNEGIRISSIVADLIDRNWSVADESDGLGEILRTIDDTSPYLGIFDAVGVDRPAAEIEVPTYSGSPDFADVGFWNIEHFNDQIEDRRVEDVADVVAGLAMDVLGLTEVQGDALDRLVEALRGRGFSMDYELHDVQGAQDLAVLYDRDTTEVRLRKDLGKKYSRQLGAKTRTGHSAFPRTPLFAQCGVENDGKKVEFLLIVVHLKAFGDKNSKARRKLAAEMLRDIIADIREHEGLPVVLGGDFNELLTTNVLGPLTDSPDLFALTADDATNDAISYVGASHRSLIDHIVITTDVTPGDLMGDDAAIVRLDQSVRDFSKRVSDHVPVVFRMVLRKKEIELSSEGSASGQQLRPVRSGRQSRAAAVGDAS